MRTARFFWFAVAMIFSGVVAFPSRCLSAVDLGEAAHAPTNLVLNPPPKGLKPLVQPVTGGFVVNTDSREEVRDFYNAIYPTSENVPQGSTADVSGCTPGHNSNAFQQAELRRINWFRAMAGMPAAIHLDAVDNWGSQQMAVLESANNVLDHNPTNTYDCYNTFAAMYAGGDQSLARQDDDDIVVRPFGRAISPTDGHADGCRGEVRTGCMRVFAGSVWPNFRTVTDSISRKPAEFCVL